MSILIYEKAGHVVTITLNRPQKLNAMSRNLASELEKALAGFDDDPELWVAVITGSGDRSFCVGADLKDPEHLVEPEKWEASYMKKLFSVKKPLIAAVNGYCLGGGFTVALACDIRIASENASFGTPDQKLNTVDCAASLLLSHFIPHAIAMEILFTGDPIDAREAYRVGLVNQVTPAAELLSAATKMANKICNNGPLALKACKTLNRKGRTLVIDDGVALFQALVPSVLNSEDTREGITAFIEKRKPVWKGK